MAISAGPLFRFNPSVSFHLRCATIDEVDAAWQKLSQGAKVLMPLDRYPFSERFGWLKDKYGLSWQVTPTALNELLSSGDPEETARVTQAFLKMKKSDIAALRRASESK